MKAAAYYRYGPPSVLKIIDLPIPTPQDDEVLIKIHATTVSSADSRMRGFDVNPLMWLPMRMYLGFTRPRKNILGYTVAGVVEEVGKKVTKFEKGDQVFGSTGLKGGAHAEYICLPETANLVEKPISLSYAQAASIPFGPITALHFLRKGKIQPGQRVLIYGASGAIGTAAVELAKYYGAEVTGVCSGRNAELVKKLGADKVLDYTKKAYLENSGRYDIIFDTVGKSPFTKCVKALRENGIYLNTVLTELVPLLRSTWVNMTSKKKVIGGVADDLLEDLVFLKGLYLDGKFKPSVDKEFSLDQIVKAHSYVDKGHKRGNVVINMDI